MQTPPLGESVLYLLLFLGLTVLSGSVLLFMLYCVGRIAGSMLRTLLELIQS